MIVIDLRAGTGIREEGLDHDRDSLGAPVPLARSAGTGRTDPSRAQTDDGNGETERCW
jgi:hypothetical protein